MHVATNHGRMADAGSNPVRGSNYRSKVQANVISQYEWFDSRSSGEVILAFAAVGKLGKAATFRMSCLEVQFLSAVHG